jgi:hypothetical protein
MAKANLSDDVITAGLVIGGGLVAYTLYKSFQAGQGVASYTTTKIDDTQDYVVQNIEEAKDIPANLWKGFWHETTGQGGLGLTGNTAETYTDSNRTLLGKDEGSWGWGYGPKKGWLLG